MANKQQNVIEKNKIMEGDIYGSASKKLKITNSATKKSWKLTEDEDEIDFFNQMGVSLLDSDDSSSLDLIIEKTMSTEKPKNNNDCDLESQNHEYFYQINNNKDNNDQDDNDDGDDEDDNGGDEYNDDRNDSKHNYDKFPISIKKQTVICNVNERKQNKPNITTTVPVATNLTNSVICGSSTNANTSLEIYSDTPEDKITIKNSTVMCKMTARGDHQSNQYYKDRTPLTIVTNNKLKTHNTNNNNNQNTINDKVNGEVLKMSENKNKYDMLKIVDENFYLYRKNFPKTQCYEEDNFNKLSDEIILTIFKLLPKKTLIRCGQVCKRFNGISHDESLWARLDLGGRCLRKGALGNILAHGVVILRLALADIVDPIFDESCFRYNQIDNYQCKLQYLDLSMAVITTSALETLLSKCKNLKKLSLEHIHINANICLEISKNKNLEALNLTMCNGINEEGMAHLMTIKKLLSLNISWTLLSDESIDLFVNNITSTLLRLNISGCRKTMADTSLLQLCTQCPGLLELDLSDCTLLTSEAINIVCKLDKLEYLSLSRCYSIEVTSYLTLSGLKSLQYLDVFGLLSEQAINMLQKSFPTVGINKFMHSSVARPTVGSRRTSIWGLRTRD